MTRTARRAAAIGTAALGLAAIDAVRPDPATAYVLAGTDRPYRGPVVSYWTTPALAAHAARAAAAINRGKVGMRLVRTTRRHDANIDIAQTRALGCRGTLGIGGRSGYNRGRVRVAAGCRPMTTQVTVAHELGHALGLSHEERRCATMNASGTTLPTGAVRTRRCGVRNWMATPYMADDLAGLRRVFVNTAPSADLVVPATGVAGEPVLATDRSRDRDRDIATHRIDWGDGTASTLRRTERDIFVSPAWMGQKVYATPGAYTVTLAVTDTYGRTATARAVIEIAPPFIEPPLE